MKIKMNRTTLLNISLNEPLSYEKLMDVSTEELQLLKEESEIVIAELKTLLVKQFEQIKPGLQKMREYKQALRNIKEKREIYSTFLSIDKDKNLLSTTSTVEERVKNVKLSDLFTDIDNDNLLEDPVGLRTSFAAPSGRASLLDDEVDEHNVPPPPNTSPVKPEPSTPRRGRSPVRSKSPAVVKNSSLRKTSIPMLRK